MSLKFDDIMKKFYSDPKLGIKKVEEDAPTNNAGSGAVSMPPDAAIKKKKKNPYDGRTKEARQFFQRMAERKAKREEKSKLTKQVQENTLERASHLAEDNVDILKDIVKRKQNQQVKLKDGKLRVDLFSASAIVQVYDAVNASNKKKMADMLNGNKAQFMKIADFALSKVK